MTKQTKALKLALETAFNLGQQFKLQCEQARWHKGQRELADKTKMVFKQFVENTIKEVLANHIPDATKMVAQPEQEPVAHPFEDKAVISSLSWAAGLIEQAYRECGGHNGADSWLMNYADKQGERIRQADHRKWEKVNGRWRVKATPPQRTWVGLTDTEKYALSNDVAQRGVPVFEAICEAEAKLKEKNT